MQPTEKEQIPKSLGSFLKLLLLKIHGKRKYYLLPIWILLAFIALLLIVSGHSYVLPAIYVLF